MRERERASPGSLPSRRLAATPPRGRLWKLAARPLPSERALQRDFAPPRWDSRMHATASCSTPRRRCSPSQSPTRRTFLSRCCNAWRGISHDRQRPARTDGTHAGSAHLSAPLPCVSCALLVLPLRQTSQSNSVSNVQHKSPLEKASSSNVDRRTSTDVFSPTYIQYFPRGESAKKCAYVHEGRLARGAGGGPPGSGLGHARACACTADCS